MPITPFPHGLSSFGIPLVGNGETLPRVSGKVLFVDAVSGNDGMTGEAPGAAFATIGRAILGCVDGAGDIVYVFPGSYAENVVVNKDYVNVIGAIEGGYARPDVVPATGVPITVTGQGCALIHIRAAGVAADSVVQSGNGFIHFDCVFDGDGTAAKAGLRLIGTTATSHTASEGKVLGSLFRGCANGVIFDVAPTPNLVGSTDNLFIGNTFYANTLDFATAETNLGGTYSVQFTDIGPFNVFQDKNKATYIDLTTANGGAASAQSGTIVGNWFATDTSTTTKFKMVATGFTFMGNYSTVGLIDGSGLD